MSCVSLVAAWQGSKQGEDAGWEGWRLAGCWACVPGVNKGAVVTETPPTALLVFCEALWGFGAQSVVQAETDSDLLMCPFNSASMCWIKWNGSKVRRYCPVVKLFHSISCIFGIWESLHQCLRVALTLFPWLMATVSIEDIVDVNCETYLASLRGRCPLALQS